MVNKVYKKGKVHPVPTSTLSADDHLSLFLPTTILALAASLSLHDKEVLAYFLSCSGSGGGDLVAARPSVKELRGKADHAPQFECVCFGCYVSFWSRWDSSPNRHVIDEIIEAFEEHERRAAAAAVTQRRVRQGRRGRKEWKHRGEAEDGAPAGGAAGEAGVPSEAVEAAGEGCSKEEAGEVERGLVTRIGTTIGFKIWNFLDRITM